MRRRVPTRDALEAALAACARDLEEHGDAVLRGDFSMFEEIGRLEERNLGFYEEVYLSLLRRGLDDPGPPDVEREAQGAIWSIETAEIVDSSRASN